MEDTNNSSDLSEFFSALSKEKKETRQKLKEQIANPESGLSNLFQQLEEVHRETQKVSEETSDNKSLSPDDQNKLEAFSSLMSSVDVSLQESQEETPEIIKPPIVAEVFNNNSEKETDKLETFSKLFGGLAKVEEKQEPQKELVIEGEVSKPQIVAQETNNIISDVISNLDAMELKTEVKEEVDQITSIRTEFEKFKTHIQQHISNQGFSGGGSGETRVEFLDDVDRDTAKVNGKALVYDSSTGKWKGESVLTGAITGLDIDGGTDIGANLADADLIIVDDGAGGTNRKATLSRLKTYIGAGAADDLGAGDAAVTLTTSSGNITIDAAANDSDIIFKGTDGGADTTFLTIDGSAAGAATFNDKIIATELDISGDVDIDGTLEADAITVNGTSLAETISDTVGAMVGSNTETGIAVTYQDGDNTLDFALGAAQTTITSLLATDIKIGEDDQTKIDFETADEIHFYAANAHQVKLVDGALVPVTDNDIDLGTSSLEFKDAFFDGTVTSDAFAGPLTGDVTGDVTGTADVATVATTVTITDNESTNESNALIFTAGGDVDGGNLGLESDGTLTYNPSTGIVTATGFAGALTGNVTGNASGTAATVTGAAQTNITSVGTLTALQVDNININTNTISTTAGTDLLITPVAGQQIVLDGTIIIDAGVVTGATSITSTAFVGDITGDVTGTADAATAVTVADESSDTTCFPLFATAATGDLPPKSGTNLTFNSSSGLLTATLLAGDLTGDVTGTADTATVATTVTITDNESTNESNALIFTAGGDVDGGNLGLESDGTLTYNPSTGIVTATGFAGALTGNVTGNASGTAATVTGAAQTAITSVGTLTALQVDNININLNTISSTAGTDLLITPLSGQQIVLDGTIIIDAGVVTGATSITSTAFVGDITGDVTGTSDVATAVTVADESSDTTCFPLFATAVSGNLPPKSGTNLTFNSSSGLLTATSLAGTVATATQNSITTATALVSVGALDSGSITSGFTSIDVGAGAITTTGVTTTGSLVGGSVATEHGAGAVATSFAPITRRYTQNGVIITKIHFDLTGLVANGDTANDVIGLSAGGAAYIGRHVVSSNGIVFKAELACIELPVAATGTVTTDIDIATNSADDIAYDAAGGTAKLFNAGVMVAGQELSNITPAITANDYFYLVEADTTANDSVFNAGQYILTLYGHAIS